MADSGSIPRGRTEENLARRIFRAFLDSGTQAMILHRMAYFCAGRGIPGVPAMIRRLNILFTGADIHPKAKIEKGVCLIHSVGTVIGEGVRINAGCEIYGGVTLGGRGGDRLSGGQPVIEADTVICAGAIVIGDITVGRNVTVAAGSVVLDAVPDSVMVAGNPAVIKVRYAER